MNFLSAIQFLLGSCPPLNLRQLKKHCEENSRFPDTSVYHIYIFASMNFSSSRKLFYINIIHQRKKDYIADVRQ